MQIHWEFLFQNLRFIGDKVNSLKMGSLRDTARPGKNIGSLGESDAENWGLNSLTYSSPPELVYPRD